MSIDLSKLSPAPWAVHDVARPDHSVCHETGDNSCRPLFERWDGSLDTTDAAFIALARNAFDVMLRRGWWASLDSPWVDPANPWVVEGLEFLFDYSNAPQRSWPDAFTALVEADRWYKENVEKATPVQ